MSKPPRKPAGKKSSAKSPHSPKNPKPRDQPDKVEILVNGVRQETDPIFEAAVLRAMEAARKPLPKEMTTNQAAEFLDVSRPFVIKLIKRGELPCRMVGKHRRIPTEALEKYRHQMLQKATEALNEMTEMLQKAGIYFKMEGPPPKKS